MEQWRYSWKWFWTYCVNIAGDNGNEWQKLQLKVARIEICRQSRLDYGWLDVEMWNFLVYPIWCVVCIQHAMFFFPWKMAVEAKCWCIFPMGQNVKANGPQIWWKSVVWTCHLSWAAQLVDHTHMNVFLWMIVMFAPWVHPLKLTWKPENWVKMMFLFVFRGFFVDLHLNPFLEAATSMGIKKNTVFIGPAPR